MDRPARPLALVTFWLLVQAAKYQEKAAQGLLFHTVFLQRWERPKETTDALAKEASATPGPVGTVPASGEPSGNGAQAPAASGTP